MKSIELVTHCWARDLEQYAYHLAAKIWSLDREVGPSQDVTLCVCHSLEDPLTREVLDWFTGDVSRFRIRTIDLPPARLGRRAIGRNLAAKSSEADVVWFDDVDQMYRNGILYRLAELQWPDGATMIFPREIRIHKDHATGDAWTGYVKRSWRLGVSAVVEGDFVPKQYNRAIGGVQIVRGDFTREYGYLDGDEKWQRPTDGKFATCGCDLAYRRFCGSKGRIVGVDLPGVYRIRHTIAGHGRPASL